MTGPVAWFVNGVAMYGMSDGFSYNGANVWQNLAMEFNKFDMDVCNGMATSNTPYHRKLLLCSNSTFFSKYTFFILTDYGYSPCLAERLGDKGLSHSPIYGFSTDGFPIYGPYQANGQVAVSCWQKRDYRSSSPTGCSTGTRSCVLTNPLDYKQGKQTVSSGPSLSSFQTSASGNTISGISGIYKQDYFYNAS
jgi:hypothetical protein